eukprot:jgi/Tetstr1/466253/TSEL_010809.t1
MFRSAATACRAVVGGKPWVGATVHETSRRMLCNATSVARCSGEGVVGVSAEKSSADPPSSLRPATDVAQLTRFASQSAHSVGYRYEPGPHGYAFHMPPISLIGANSLPQSGEVISRLGFRKALLVTDKFLSQRGGTGFMISVLVANDIDYHVFDGVSSNPTRGEVEHGLRVLSEQGCDFILSFGGGSPHDAAKVISLLKTNGGDVSDYVGVNLAKAKGFPLVAVGTSGTASEMTRFACITDEDRMSKLSIIDDMMTPVVTVEDPAVLRMPRHLTAATGMDCLTHAIEAYLSTHSNPVTDATALHSIKLAAAFLCQAHATTNYSDLQERKANSRARDMMGYASYLAGMAFNNAGLGLVHAMSHQIGGLYNLPHGVCCAVLLPSVLEFNAVARPAHIEDIANAIGLKANTSSEALTMVISFVLDLNRNLGFAPQLAGTAEMGVVREDFELMARNALHDSCLLTNCRQHVTTAQIESLFELAYSQDFEWR